MDLPSGGFLVIEPTEALTAIDVNSGKQLGGRKNTFLYSVNQEAAREIARQIRLRGISGLIPRLTLSTCRKRAGGAPSRLPAG